MTGYEGDLPAWEVPPFQWRHQSKITIGYSWRLLKNIFSVLEKRKIFSFTATLFLGPLSGVFQAFPHNPTGALEGN